MDRGKKLSMSEKLLKASVGTYELLKISKNAVGLVFLSNLKFLFIHKICCQQIILLLIIKKLFICHFQRSATFYKS